MNHPTPAISVIVAVYKAESYIRRCLETIRNQTFTDFEVLLVDDGSPDGSGEICDEYAAADSRFRVFHKENGGVASARQCGVDNARGEYIIHIDPDDWVELNMLELLYRKAVETGAELIICNIMAERESGQTLFSHCIDSENKFIIDYKRCNYAYEYRMGLANKLAKRSLYSGVYFPIGLKVCEDTYVFLIWLSRKVTIATISDYLYHYDMFTNGNSLSGYGNPSKEYFFNRWSFIIKTLNGSKDIDRNLKGIEISKFAHTAFYYSWLTQYEYTKAFYPCLKNILFGYAPIHRKINIFLSVIGLKWLIRCPYIIMKKICFRNRKK